MCTQVRRVHHVANSYTHIGLSHGWKFDSVCSCVFYSLPVNCGCFRYPRASAAASFEAAVFFIHALVIYPHHCLFLISSIVIRMVFCEHNQSLTLKISSCWDLRKQLFANPEILLYLCSVFLPPPHLISHFRITRDECETRARRRQKRIESRLTRDFFCQNP